MAQSPNVYFAKKDGGKEICDQNPEAKMFMQKHIKCMAQKTSRYTNKKKCWYCLSDDHTSESCG